MRVKRRGQRALTGVNGQNTLYVKNSTVRAGLGLCDKKVFSLTACRTFVFFDLIVMRTNCTGGLIWTSILFKLQHRYQSYFEQ